MILFKNGKNSKIWKVHSHSFLMRCYSRKKKNKASCLNAMCQMCIINNAEKVLHKKIIFRTGKRDQYQRTLWIHWGTSPFTQIIGRGAFATVYSAKMKYYPYMLRAVKRIKKKFVKTPADIINEYSILTSFDHPQIIKIYETFEDE